MTAGHTMQTVTLNNGVEMPALGLGVFQTPPEETRDAVRAALHAGYRHIDTAAAYGNERQVGEAVHRSDLGRAEVFLETKIWISDYGYDQTLHGFEKSARKLGVERGAGRDREVEHDRLGLRPGDCSSGAVAGASDDAGDAGAKQLYAVWRRCRV